MTGVSTDELERAIALILAAQGTKITNYMPTTQAKIRQAVAETISRAKGAA